MSDSAEEQEAFTKNHQVIEELREAFRASKLFQLTHEVEPATIFSPVPVQEKAE